MSPSQVIVLATPVFLLLIALEYAWGRARGRNTYRLADAVGSISLGMLSEVTKVFTRLLRVGIYAAVLQHVSLVPADAARAFWTSPAGWVLALVFYDFCYYWLHRAGHESAVFWAAHVVHHQSQDYNLSTALRQSSSGVLLGWIFYIPMALAGVPVIVMGVVALVDLLYQFWVHTEHVGKLGWFDRWFCSPSNHRVHHAVNEGYLDRNYGGVLIIWDRLFGSFAEETEPCVYGTRKPLDSWDPLWANAEVYWALARDSWHTRRWSDKLRVWVKPPGWRPADVAQRFPAPPFDLAQWQRFDPPVSRSARVFGASQFTLLLGGVAVFLWHADRMPLPQAFVWLGALTAGLWSASAVLQGRLRIGDALLVDLAALTTAAAADNLLWLYQLAKPAVMLLAIALVWQRLADAPRRFRNLLGAALALSLAGDVFLMVQGHFIEGLIAFLLAHLCFIALFRLGQPWFPSRRALFATLAAAVLLYALLFPHLGPVLRGAVAVYALAIALMAAQAIGRAGVLQDGASRWVAVGACFFMLSDSVLAINKFAMPVPLGQFWVLATYYAAQILISRHAQPGRPVLAHASAPVPASTTTGAADVA